MPVASMVRDLNPSEVVVAASRVELGVHAARCSRRTRRKRRSLPS
jgi:hypothetical protein